MDIELPDYRVTETHGALLRTFDCDAVRATLTILGCAKRWTRAQDRMSDETLEACGRCQLGAHHAGKPFVLVSPHFGARLCPRCDRGDARMIQGRVCVSCYNREAEVERGRNARGNAPTRARSIHAVRLTLVADNRPRRVDDAAVGLAEVMRRALRNTKGGVAFAPNYASRTQGIQQELRFA